MEVEGEGSTSMKIGTVFESQDCFGLDGLVEVVLTPLLYGLGLTPLITGVGLTPLVERERLISLKGPIPVEL